MGAEDRESCSLRNGVSSRHHAIAMKKRNKPCLGSTIKIEFCESIVNMFFEMNHLEIHMFM